MDNLERMKLRTQEEDEAVLLDCLESARSAIMSRRFPFQPWPNELEPQYLDLQYRIAMDLFNKTGAEGETAHSENGISRSYESSWISQQLLNEVTPMCGVV
ncbi:DNA-packaging protein [Colidextribacter sp. OB.20]|uniref:phage head-tail connector protein n=1 Tax=Colidextribacter sp. OB.20 TaxID=2304568 RepID=UPI001368319E|nr:phage head-tail connector protein [Colidextribacter sp. OB.20]NBI10251.1 DNA-packaging protein [Colidextribacter sp. OB.20]